ncbi:MAG TPA: hypothetical protein VNH14_17135 [Gemmatimonadales bacterium]|nr:hypothetical protein [Gemmatimonadales bacterium]
MNFTLSRTQKLIIAGVVILPIFVFALYTWAALTWSYSKGERAGYVQKFSKKGWICKTWEGELAIVSIPGTMAEKFNFTVRNDSVARLVNQTLGKRVTLAYRQHMGIPTTCFGETQYFVVDVKAVE